VGWILRIAHRPSLNSFTGFGIENEIWFALEDDASRRPLNALELNYVRHYNGSNDRTAAAMSFFFLLPISSVTNTESQPRIPCLERSNLTMDTFGSWSASPFLARVLKVLQFGSESAGLTNYDEGIEKLKFCFSL